MKSYISADTPLNQDSDLSREEFMELHNIRNTVVVIKFVYSESEGIWKKTVIDDLMSLRLFNKCARVNGWDDGTNDMVRQAYEQHPSVWEAVLTDLTRNNSENAVYRVNYAMDTSKICVLDVDDNRGKVHPFVKTLLDLGTPFYKSSGKGFEKLLLKINNMPPQHKNNIELMVLDNKVALEIQAGMWSFINKDAVIINGKNDIAEVDYEDIVDAFPLLGNSNHNIVRQGISNPQSPSNISKDQMVAFLSQLPLTVFMEYQRPNCPYDYCWLNMCYMLKSWNEVDGLELLHTYSKKIPSKYNEDSVNAFYSRQNSDGDYSGFFKNMALHHDIDIFRSLPSSPPVLDDGIVYKYGFIVNACREACVACVGDMQTDGMNIYALIHHALQNPQFDLIFNRYFKFDVLLLFADLKFDYDTTKRLFETQIFRFIKTGIHRICAGRLESFGVPLPWLMYKGVKTVVKKKRRTDPKTLEEIEDMEEEKTMVLTPFLRRWETDDQARTYSHVVFDPSHIGHFDDKYNLYDGLACEKTVSKHPYVICSDDDLNEVLDYIKVRICGDHNEFYEWFLNYLAHLIQHPDKMTMVNVIIKGKQGSGKSMFVDWFGKCMIGDEYFLCSSNPKQITGQFNGDLENKILINFDEASNKDTFQAEEKLKSYITSPVLQIERKRQDFITVPNHINFITTTNNTCPYAIPPDDRRFCGVETTAEPMTTEEIKKWMTVFSPDNIPLICRLYDFLRQRNIHHIHLQRTRPLTEFYAECKTICASTVCTFIFYYLTEDRDSPRTDSHDIYFSELFERYVSWNATHNANKQPISAKMFSIRINRELPSIYKKRRQTDGRDRLYYEFHRKPVLDALRAVGLTEFEGDERNSTHEPLLSA